MVFGVFLLAKAGTSKCMAEAAPMEFAMIFGAAVAAQLVAQRSCSGLMKASWVASAPMVKAGPKWKQARTIQDLARAALPAHQADEDQRASSR
jgi:hypothetical protein